MINLFALVCDPFSTFIHARGFVPSSVTGRKHDDENSPHFRTRMRLHVSVLSSNKGYITKKKKKKLIGVFGLSSLFLTSIFSQGTGTNPINGVEIVYDKIGGFNGPMIVVTGAT